MRQWETTSDKENISCSAWDNGRQRVTRRIYRVLYETMGDEWHREWIEWCMTQCKTMSDIEIQLQTCSTTFIANFWWVRQCPTRQIVSSSPYAAWQCKYNSRFSCRNKPDCTLKIKYYYSCTVTYYGKRQITWKLLFSNFLPIEFKYKETRFNLIHRVCVKSLIY